MRYAMLAIPAVVLCGFVSPAAGQVRALAEEDLPDAQPLLAWPRIVAAAVTRDAERSEPPKRESRVQSSRDPTYVGDESVREPAVWFEQADKKYQFIGLRARVVYIPEFIFGLFQADGGESVLAPSLGPEYVTRRNGFEVDMWLTYTSYGFDNVPFKSKSDPDEAYELVTSAIKTLTVGADVLWTKQLNKKGLSLVYGGGAGIGAVFGDLRRNQAYPPSGIPGDPEEYERCPRPNFGPGNYCDTDNDHYGNYSEPNWFNGGSKPVLFPWIALPQVGLRWKASRQFVLRVDTGLSFPGPFFLGVSGQYGLL